MPVERRIRILLLIPHLGGGGAEHVIAQFARFLDRQKFDVHLGLVTKSLPPAPGQLLRCTVHRLGATRVRAASWSLLKLIWRVRPHVIISGIAHLNLLVILLRFLFPAETRILVRQTCALNSTLADLGFPRLAAVLYRFAYRRADAVLCQSGAMADEIHDLLGVPTNRLYVLPNPVEIEAIRASVPTTETTWNVQEPNLLAMGRLVPEKGFDLLLKAFACIRNRYPAAVLVIAGDGPCKSDLQSQCAKLNLETGVKFIGHIPSPAACFSRSTAFVLSSRDDALPNALLEAAAAGLPIVALPSSPGVACLLREKPGVWLGTEVSAEALKIAMLQALSAIKPQQRFSHSWIEAFDAKKAVQACETAIDRVLGAHRP